MSAPAKALPAVKYISRQDFAVNVNTHLTAGVLCTVRMVTDPDLNKTGNPFWDKASKTWKVHKVQTLSVYFGSKAYEEQVNAKLLKKWKNDLLSDPTTPQPAAFVAQPRVYGAKVPGKPWIHYNKDGEDRWYVQLSVYRQIAVAYVDDKLMPVSYDLLKPFEPTKSVEGKRQIEAGLDPEEVLVYRTPKLESLVSVTYDHKLVVIEENQNYQNVVLS